MICGTRICGPLIRGAHREHSAHYADPQKYWVRAPYPFRQAKIKVVAHPAHFTLKLWEGFR